jgi:hypothetical protein
LTLALILGGSYSIIFSNPFLKSNCPGIVLKESVSDVGLRITYVGTALGARLLAAEKEQLALPMREY